jgi:hypothetical protein
LRRDRRARDRVVDDAVRVDRQVEVLKLLPDSTTMSLMRCRPFVKSECARPSIAVFGPAPGRVKRSSYLSVVP